ncbi:MAG TPA: SCO1664 family protein [Actinomycetota bacterium]|nr:SCO1664 family protein [Actinomycetota bacterium]
MNRDDAEVLSLLERGEIEPLGLLPRSSNFTFLCRVRGDGAETLAVYKPRAGETPLWDFPEGTLCRREVAAYVLAEALGWPRVPPTVLRDGPQGPGSLQRFLRFDPERHYFTMLEDRPDDFRRVALFDVVANNADRKSGHCLLADDGELFVVDHGVCFAAEPKLRTVIWDFVGEPIPADLRADLEDLTSTLSHGDLREQLVSLLSDAEVDATERRLAEILELGRFPEPGPGRPYPWPVV